MDPSNTRMKVPRIHNLLSYCQTTLAVKLCSNPNLIIGLSFLYKSESSFMDRKVSYSSENVCMSYNLCEIDKSHLSKAWRPVSQRCPSATVTKQIAADSARETGNLCILDRSCTLMKLAEIIAHCPSNLQRFLNRNLYGDTFFGGLVNRTCTELLGVVSSEQEASSPALVDSVSYPYVTFMMACYRRTCDGLRSQCEGDAKRFYSTTLCKTHCSLCETVSEQSSDSGILSIVPDVLASNHYSSCEVAIDTESCGEKSSPINVKSSLSCTCPAISACEYFLEPQFDSGLPDENIATKMDGDVLQCRTMRTYTDLGSGEDLDDTGMTIWEQDVSFSGLVNGDDDLVEQAWSDQNYTVNPSVLSSVCDQSDSLLVMNCSSKSNTISEIYTSDSFDDTSSMDDNDTSHQDWNDIEPKDGVKINNSTSDDDVIWDSSSDHGDDAISAKKKNMKSSLAESASSSFFVRGSVSDSSDTSSNSGDDDDDDCADDDDDEDWLAFREPTNLVCLEDFDPLQVSGLYIPPSSTTPIKRSLNCSMENSKKSGGTAETECDSPIKVINDNWNRAYDSSKKASAGPAVKSKMVSFEKTAPVFIPVLNGDEWAEDYYQARRAYWEELARDRDRFQRRVVETAAKIEWVLNLEHRSKVLARTPVSV